MNIYLDVDGVIIGDNMQPAAHANEFINYIVTNYPENTFWLSSLCQGDTAEIIQNIGYHFDKETLELLKKIKPTNWAGSIKTRAIDFSQPFLWFDDNLAISDRVMLIEHGVLDNWVEVNLRKDANRLDILKEAFPALISAVKTPKIR